MMEINKDTLRKLQFNIAGEIHSACRFDNGDVKIYLNNKSREALTIVNFPPKTSLSGLIGTKIWADFHYIMIGNKKWAKRIRYNQIRLLEIE